MIKFHNAISLRISHQVSEYQTAFLKLYGTVQDIDNDDREFELCDPSIPVQIDENSVDSNRCVDVVFTDRTSVFDVNGMPAGNSSVRLP